MIGITFGLNAALAGYLAAKVVNSQLSIKVNRQLYVSFFSVTAIILILLSINYSVPADFPGGLLVALYCLFHFLFFSIALVLANRFSRSA